MKNVKKSGFSLVELLVVILIMGILFSIVIPALLHARERAKQTRRENDKSTLTSAIENYRHEYGVWPCPEPGATNMVFSNANHEVIAYLNDDLGNPNNPHRVKFLSLGDYRFDTSDGSYAPNVAIVDPWGEPYTITINWKADTVKVE